MVHGEPERKNRFRKYIGRSISLIYLRSGSHCATLLLRCSHLPNAQATSLPTIPGKAGVARSGKLGQVSRLHNLLSALRRKYKEGRGLVRVYPLVVTDVLSREKIEFIKNRKLGTLR